MIFPEYRLLLPNAKRFPRLVPRNYLTTWHGERSASNMVYKRGDSLHLWLRRDRSGLFFWDFWDRF